MNPVNAEEVKHRKQLTNTEKLFLNELGKKYITAHCDHQQDSAPADNNDDNPIMRRTLTDTVNADLSKSDE